VPYEDVSFNVRRPSSGGGAGLIEADLAPSQIRQGFGGTTEIQKEIIARSLGL
jgi:hypothetical protein